MDSPYTNIHVEKTLLPQYVFSGWGNKMSPKKICTTFVSGIHPHLTSIVILSPGLGKYFYQMG